MIRAILGINKKQHINMKQIRIENNMMSVNQMSVYHTLVEAHNIMRNSSSEQIKFKWTDEFENKYSLRSKSNKILKVPEKPMTKCTGFSYCGSKLYNMLPSDIKESVNMNTFKSLTKKWIWKYIPSF